MQGEALWKKIEIVALPTAKGNSFQSFESYSHCRLGLEEIHLNEMEKKRCGISRRERHSLVKQYIGVIT